MNLDNMKYEEAIQKLSEIVSTLEKGGIELDKTLALYEEGISLLRFCNQKLNEAEQKIQMVKDGKTNALEEIKIEDLS